MAKKKKPPPEGPNNAYLLSFGDTMTTLLAFFIILNSLAEDQTGANLYAGTGSFMAAISTFQLSGSVGPTGQPNVSPLEESKPVYVVPDPDADPQSLDRGPGTDEEDDGQRIIDREREEFSRYLNEMSARFDVKEVGQTEGEIVFDLFGPLNPQPPYLTEPYLDVVARILPLLRNDRYAVDVIVWATTPAPTAWKRATTQAYNIRREIDARGRLTPDQQRRLVSVGNVWIDKDARRPVVSFVAKKLGQ